MNRPELFKAITEVVAKRLDLDSQREEGIAYKDMDHERWITRYVSPDNLPPSNTYAPLFTPRVDYMVGEIMKVIEDELR